MASQHTPIRSSAWVVLSYDTASTYHLGLQYMHIFDVKRTNIIRRINKASNNFKIRVKSSVLTSGSISK